MITPYQLLQEAGFAQYTAMIRVRYNRDNTSLGAEKIAEMIRAIPGATRVSTVSLDKEHGIGIFNAKIISQKPAKEAYQALKQNALERYAGLVVGLDVGANTIEVKGDFILKEYKKPETNLSKVIGQLLKEGLLLEVSIEELRRQYVECDPPKITAEVFEQIVQTTENKSNYATWLCKKVADGLIPIADFNGWHDLFQFFDRYKQRFQKKDINQVKTAEDIEAFKQDYEHAKEVVNQKKAGGGTKEELEPCQIGTFKTSDGKTWKVYGVGKGQYPLERKIGSGAGWCTVSSQHMFDHYLKEGGKYYIFINKEHPDIEKYQIHIESRQFANKQNNPVNIIDQPTKIEFYEYLKAKEGIELPDNVIKAKKELADLKKIYENIKSAPPVDKSQFQSIDLPSGGKAYRLPLDTPENVEKNTLLLRDLKITEGEDLVALSKALFRGFHNDRNRDRVWVFSSNGTKDIVGGLLRVYDNVLSSCLDEPSNPWRSKATLPYCTADNIDDYQALARAAGATIAPDVIIRCDKSLPSLESYKWREADTRTGYKFPWEDLIADNGDFNGGKCARAFQELKNLTGVVTIRCNPRSMKPGSSMYACVSTDLDGLTIVQNDEITTAPGDFKASAANLDRMVKIAKFLNINLDEENSSNTVHGILHRWIKVGRWQGILQGLRNTVTVPGVDSSNITVANIESLKDLIGRSDIDKCYAVYATGDISQVYVLTNQNTYIWSPANNPSSIDTACVRQADFGRIQGIRPKDLGPIYIQLGLNPPSTLEKLMGRTRPGANPNVLQALRANMDNFQRRTLNLHQYNRGWQQGRPYFISGDGIYGTWDQLGNLIAQSSPENYQHIVRELANHPNTRIDVFLYFNADDPRRTWNGAVRAINPETNRVEWYARRYGNGMNVQWIFRDLQPDEQPDAGNQGEGNYRAPQPRPERVPRQARQAQAAQPAAPAPEINQEMREQLAQLRRQSQNSPEVYVIPANRTDEILPALGFTNLNPGGNRSVVVYRAYEHRGQTTHVALIYGNGQTIVAGYPQNPTTATAAADSQQWRRLTHQLDNSVRTFQQCHNICQELHITLPVAIQGWLVYRGQ